MRPAARPSAALVPEVRQRLPDALPVRVRLRARGKGRARLSSTTARRRDACGVVSAGKGQRLPLDGFVHGLGPPLLGLRGRARGAREASARWRGAARRAPAAESGRREVADVVST